jgi:lysophospholipase L1-like esterase
MRSRPTSRNQAHDNPRAKRRRLPRPGRITVAVVAGVALTGGAAAAAAEAVSAPVPTGTARTAGAPAHVRTKPAAPPKPRPRHARTIAPQGVAGGPPLYAPHPPPGPALRTSCKSVAHVGDSTSVDLISPSFLPDPAQRLQARYAAAGVRHLKLDASGGRSIVETLPGQVNGYDVAGAWREQGYRGCWVFALGTNDAANISAGSTVDQLARIDQMMSVTHGEPVMWVNARTMLTSGSWSNANEQAWDKALLIANRKYPNMRIFDWSAIAQPGWFLPDGIHYNSLGCQLRAAAIANALTKAFPLNGHSKGQVVK